MSGKPLRMLGIEIDLSGKEAKDDLNAWNREVREAVGLADDYVDGVDDMAREMRDYAKRIGLTKEQLSELQKTSKRNRDIGDFAKKYGLEASEIKRIGAEAAEAKKQVSSLNGVMGALAAIGVGSVVKSIGVELVDLAKQAERTAITFEVMLKDKNKAKEVLNMLKDFSDVTPFSDTEAIMAGKQLINAKVPLDQLKQTLTDIGNVAAGSEVPFNELAEIYAKNKMSGVIQLEDINQLAGRGLPIMDALAKSMGVQSTQIRALTSSGAVNFGHLQKAFQIMSKDDYPGLMDRLSMSAEGLSSTFDSKVTSIKRTLGSVLLEGLKPLWAVGIQFIDWLQNNKTAMNVVKVGFLVLIPIIGTLLVAALWSAAAAAWGLIVPLLPIIAIVALVGAAILGLILIFEDLYQFFTGGDSIIGEWVSSIKTKFAEALNIVQQWKDNVIGFFKTIPDKIMGILASLKDFLKGLLPDWALKLLASVKISGETKQIQARAGGGDINSGDEYLVGEDGPELFRSDRAGTIIPNHTLGGGRKSTSITLAPVFNISGVTDPETVANLAMKKLENMLPLIAAELGFGLG